MCDLCPEESVEHYFSHCIKYETERENLTRRKEHWVVSAESILKSRSNLTCCTVATSEVQQDFIKATIQQTWEHFW